MTRKIEFRTVNKKAETNADEIDGKKIIAGVIPYNSKSQRMSLGYSDCEYEMLSPTVFKKTLADKADVYVNYAHDDMAILGNTKSGTLKLQNRDDGLYFTLELDPENEIAMRAYSTIKRNDCNTLSFEFYPYDWIEEDGVCVLRSAKLLAISLCVINPAYKETDTETIRSRGISEMEKITRALENKEIDITEPETLEQVVKMINEIKKQVEEVESKFKSNQPAEKEIDTAETVEPAKTDEQVEAPEQPKDIPAEETKPEVDVEKQKELEEIQKEIEKELSE